MAMRTRILGSGEHALEVSAQGLGCMGMAANYGPPMAESDAAALLAGAFEAGVTFWDTAEAYQCTAPDGKTLFNETQIGAAIAARKLPRDKLKLATKYMPSLHEEFSTDAVVANHAAP